MGKKSRELFLKILVKENKFNENQNFTNKYIKDFFGWRRDLILKSKMQQNLFDEINEELIYSFLKENEKKTF